MKPIVLFFVMLSAVPSSAQDKTPVEIVGVQPHSHVLCAIANDDPWHSCLVVAYKNVSAQPITAIRFEATFINAMMESDPSVYSYNDTRKVKPGKTQVALWGDGVYWQQYGDKMGASVRVIKVMFADGTFWTPGPDRRCLLCAPGDQGWVAAMKDNCSHRWFADSHIADCSKVGDVK